MIPNIDLPKGFLAAGLHAGIRRYRPDLGLIYSKVPCSAAGVFTTNSLKAASVLYNQALLPAEDIRAIVVNSGHANAATGIDGINDNFIFAQKTAQALKIDQKSVLVCSTGIIGERMPLDMLVPALSNAERGFSDKINSFSLAIMTTDLVPKFSHKQVQLSTGSVIITGACKGSGMIHPNMATMLGFILTDAKIEKDAIAKMTRECADASFNMISVDGETSTNDTVLFLANGASETEVKTDADKKIFHAALLEVFISLAKQIAQDGEGATKLITVHVKNASTLKEAREAARMITTSPLIKSAIHGEDPNWGRILSRLGQAGVKAESFEKLSVKLQDTVVYSEGKPMRFDRAETRSSLRTEEVLIEVNLQGGSHEATAWGCDLTKRYVEINTEYS